MTDLPNIPGGCERLARLMAAVAMEPMRESLERSYAEMKNAFNGGAAERARQMIKENRRG
ncbi:hypothetical protein [Sphingomonas sp.]|uniref:hypothetical protein n=1 Tax=Sphingomonas sp. TaxID=28214 RepID=UPI0031E3F8E5